MIWFLRALFSLILLAMLVVTIQASLHTPIWQLPPSLTGDPWFRATLFDAYFGFLTFFIWVAYKEASWGRSVLWFVLIMLLGNIAMSIYMLIQLFRVPAHASLREVFLRS
jgi:hypothetical protein